jgi:hypothetical protein
VEEVEEVEEAEEVEEVEEVLPGPDCLRARAATFLK